MKIAITQRQTEINGIVYDCLEQGWYRLFKDHELCLIPNLVDVTIEESDILVLSGGNETQQRLKTELTVCDWAMRNNKPIIGICHGAFFLNYVFGGVNAEITGHRNVLHNVLLEGVSQQVNSYHDICIYELGKNLISIASHNDHCEAYRHRDYPIWGLVWHPERMDNPVLPSDLRKLIYG